MSNTANLPYVCNCGCDFVNGDMFEDYFRHLGKEPTEEDIINFKVAQRIFWAMRDKRKEEQNNRKMEAPKRKPRPYNKTSNHWSNRKPTKSQSTKQESR